MNWIDIAIVATVLISTAISIASSFLKEMVSLLTWIAAFWISFAFAVPVSSFLPPVVDPLILASIAFVILFVLIFVAGFFVARLAVKLVDRIGLTTIDRGLGVLFGIVRGAVVVVAVVMLASFTSIPQGDAWRSSRLVTHFEVAAAALYDLLPHDMATQLPSPP